MNPKERMKYLIVDKSSAEMGEVEQYPYPEMWKLLSMCIHWIIS